MKDALDWLVANWTHIAPVVTALGILIAALSLRANHDWNRRHYAMQMVADWNPKTSAHRKAIEKVIPGLIDVDRTNKTVVELSKARASEIYCSKPGTEDWELRFHLIELGNYFEFISSAYINHVGDRAMIGQAFRGPLIRWHDVLSHFVEVVQDHRGYAPWAPFSELVAHWKRPKKMWFRGPTA